MDQYGSVKRYCRGTASTIGVNLSRKLYRASVVQIPHALTPSPTGEGEFNLLLPSL
jgi:hypothetical protein